MMMVNSLQQSQVIHAWRYAHALASVQMALSIRLDYSAMMGALQQLEQLIYDYALSHTDLNVQEKWRERTRQVVCHELRLPNGYQHIREHELGNVLMALYVLMQEEPSNALSQQLACLFQLLKESDDYTRLIQQILASLTQAEFKTLASSAYHDLIGIDLSCFGALNHQSNH